MAVWQTLHQVEYQLRSIDFLNKKTEIIKLKEANDANAFSFDIETSAGTKTIAMSTPAINEVNAINMELTAFKDSIVQNSKTIVSEMDGLLAMDVAHQILEKIGNNVIAH
jgi:hypothetical protein